MSKKDIGKIVKDAGEVAAGAKVIIDIAGDVAKNVMPVIKDAVDNLKQKASVPKDLTIIWNGQKHFCRKLI